MAVHATTRRCRCSFSARWQPVADARAVALAAHRAGAVSCMKRQGSRLRASGPRRSNAVSWYSSSPSHRRLAHDLLIRHTLHYAHGTPAARRCPAGEPRHARESVATRGSASTFAEFLWDPRVIEMPRPLWWLILHGVILRMRPRRTAHAYRKIWTAQGSPLMVESRRLRAVSPRNWLAGSAIA